MKKIILLLFLIPLTLFAQVKYEAQLSWFQLEIAPEILLAAMPYNETEETEAIKKEYANPALEKTFIQYSPFEAYIHNLYYAEIKKALKERFGITISSMVNKEKATDSTVYGFPRVGASDFDDNSGFYFVKINILVGALESGPQVAGQAPDKTTLTPTIQMNLTLFDKDGKKIKKASSKFQSRHFVDGTVVDYTHWDGKSRMRGFKANETVRRQFLIDLLQQGLGKLQESYYK